MRKLLCVIIPCYRSKNYIVEVLSGIPDFINKIYIIDDCCPDKTGDFVINNFSNNKYRVIKLPYNQGVGAALITGYKAALADGMTIMIKMDGDNQMDPFYLKRLVTPILEGRADYTKGNRFFDFNSLKSMPRERLFGNMVLTFMAKVSTGYWEVSDPTNGYTAIHRSVFKLISLEDISKRYYFEISLLSQLNIARALVLDVPIPARYGNEISSLKITNVLITYPLNLMKSLVKRIILRYYLYEISMASILFIIGLPFLLFGVFYGGYNWYRGSALQIVAPPGTVGLSLVFIIIGFQMLIQAILVDVINKPHVPLAVLFKDGDS